VSSIIVGAMSPEQLDGSLRALDWKITPEELDEVDRLAPSPAPRWLGFLVQAGVR
jgi:aryl-alcohol dehydrogenase-like predicted oxidoreductase